MHLQAQQTERELLPDAICEILHCHEQRRVGRSGMWREHTAAAREFRAAHGRMSATTASGDRGRFVDGLEF
jgi:hypothetical protein